jgi:hypothetical protein
MLESRRLLGPAVLAVAVLVLGGLRPARADELIDQQKRINAVRTQALKERVRNVLLEARSKALNRPEKSVDILRQARTEVEEARYLSAEDRQTVLRAVDGAIRTYQQRARDLGRTVADTAARGGAARDREQQIREQSKRDEQLQHMLRQKSELLKAGRYDEIERLGADARRKFGNVPAVDAFDRMASARRSYEEIRGLRNERDRRYRQLYTSIARSAMPIVGDVEFPPAAQWRALTKRRTEKKLTETEKKIIKALNTPITTSLKDKPLHSVLEYFEKTTGLPLEVDKAALEFAQINYETPVSVEARQTSLRTVLKSMLSKVGLTFIIRNETVLITTPEQASRNLVARAYYVGDLATATNFQFGPVFNQLQMVQNVAGLVAFIQSIEPGSWRDGGGQGTIFFSPASMSLLVRQSAEMHFVLMGALR